MHNNPFILQCAIEKARREGKKLYVVFVNLKNAFPATDLPTLWVKLFNAGILGPLFDWLRMLYACMCYVVHYEGAVWEAFKSLIGVLTGDSVSPILWNLYFADIDRAIPIHANDLIFGRTVICHMELWPVHCNKNDFINRIDIPRQNITGLTHVPPQIVMSDTHLHLKRKGTKF